MTLRCSNQMFSNQARADRNMISNAEFEPDGVTADPGILAFRFDFDGSSVITQTLEETAIHLWYAVLDRASDTHDILSPDERTRLMRFRFERDRRRFAASRSFLRRVLGAYLCQSPEHVVLRIAANGKPECDGLSFNMSHSGHYAVLAVALTGRIGVDIETRRLLEDVDRVGGLFLREWKSISALPSEQRLSAFFSCWTAKEALLKALGTGLSDDLDSFEVSVDLNTPPHLLSAAARHGGSERWRLFRFRIGADCLGAIAREIVAP
jgi:4'-phosphopantetheinyl transferase